DDPVPNDLPGHAADLGGLRARGAGIDRSQGEQPAGLAGVLRLARERPQLCGVEIRPERDRHGKPPAFATLNQSRPASGNTPSHALRDLVLAMRTSFGPRRNATAARTHL